MSSAYGDWGCNDLILCEHCCCICSFIRDGYCYVQLSTCFDSGLYCTPLKPSWQSLTAYFQLAAHALTLSSNML